MKLKQFIPQNFCLSCDGCCRYAEKNTAWAPLFVFEEIAGLVTGDIVPPSLFAHKDIHRGEAARVDLARAGEQFICPCFDLGNNQCKIYAYRPFDCRLYPFLLLRSEGKVYLAADEKCPFIKKTGKSAEAEKYIAYLAGFLSSAQFLKWVKANPEIVQEYPGDYRIIAALPKLTGLLYGTFSDHAER